MAGVRVRRPELMSGWGAEGGIADRLAVGRLVQPIVDGKPIKLSGCFAPSSKTLGLGYRSTNSGYS